MKNDTKKDEKKPKVVIVKEPIATRGEMLDVRDLDGTQLQNSFKK